MSENGFLLHRNSASLQFAALFLLFHILFLTCKYRRFRLQYSNKRYTSSTVFNCNILLIFIFLNAIFYVLFAVVFHHQYKTTLEIRVIRHCFTTNLFLIDINCNQCNFKIHIGITKIEPEYIHNELFCVLSQYK